MSHEFIRIPDGALIVVGETVCMNESQIRIHVWTHKLIWMKESQIHTDEWVTNYHLYVDLTLLASHPVFLGFGADLFIFPRNWMSQTSNFKSNLFPDVGLQMRRVRSLGPWSPPIWNRKSPKRSRPIWNRILKSDFKNKRRLISIKVEKNRGKKGLLQSVGTLVRPLWRAAGAGAKAPALAARPVGNGTR